MIQQEASYSVEKVICLARNSQEWIHLIFVFYIASDMRMHLVSYKTELLIHKMWFVLWDWLENLAHSWKL